MVILQRRATRSVTRRVAGGKETFHRHVKPEKLRVHLEGRGQARCHRHQQPRRCRLLVVGVGVPSTGVRVSENVPLVLVYACTRPRGCPGNRYCTRLKASRRGRRFLIKFPLTANAGTDSSVVNSRSTGERRAPRDRPRSRFHSHQRGEIAWTTFLPPAGETAMLGASASDLLDRCHPHRVMEAGVEMPAIEGVTIGMKRHNCLAHCFNENKGYKFFGERSGGRPRKLPSRL